MVFLRRTSKQIDSIDDIFTIILNQPLGTQYQILKQHANRHSLIPKLLSFQLHGELYQLARMNIFQYAVYTPPTPKEPHHTMLINHGRKKYYGLGQRETYDPHLTITWAKEQLPP